MAISRKNRSWPINEVISRTQNLQCDLASVFQILGQVDNRHAACPDFAFDRVVACEGGSDVIELIHHQALSVDLIMQ